MHRIILSTALVIAAAAPVVAADYKFPVIVNASAMKIFIDEASRSDDGETRQLGNALMLRSRAGTDAILSTQNIIRPVGQEQFARLALEADDGAGRAQAGNPGTLIRYKVANNRAQTVFTNLYLAGRADD